MNIQENKHVKRCNKITHDQNILTHFYIGHTISHTMKYSFGHKGALTVFGKNTQINFEYKNTHHFGHV